MAIMLLASFPLLGRHTFFLCEVDRRGEAREYIDRYLFNSICIGAGKGLEVLFLGAEKGRKKGLSSARTWRIGRGHVV